MNNVFEQWSNMIFEKACAETLKAVSEETR